MRIAIVTYQGYDGAGVLHAHEFANQLIALGHEVLLFLCGSIETASVLAKEPLYLVKEVEFQNGALAPSLARLVETFAPEIIHLWTPRHPPARVGLEAWSRSDARMVIHYEDDEEYILSDVGSNSTFAEDDLALYRFLRQDGYEADELESHASTLKLDFIRQTLVDPYSCPWIHPLVTPVVEKMASGFTSISPSYGRLLSERSPRPVMTLYPGVDFERFGGSEPDRDLRTKLGLEGRTVFLYSGSIASFHDFTDFVEALPPIVADHPDIVVVQIGHNYIPHITAPLLAKLGLEDHVIFAGPVPHSQMPHYLGLADLFLGVAALNPFNEHRLPSKIPEYMATGRPIILSDVGVANELDDGAEVIKIPGNSRSELEQSFRHAMDLRDSWPAMGRRLREKAQQIFDWKRNTEHLVSFYEELSDVEDSPLPEGFDPQIVSKRPPVPGTVNTENQADLNREGPHVIIVTEGRIGRLMSGIGIRYSELARSLAREFAVTLVHPGPSEVTIPGVHQLRWAPSDATALLRAAETADVLLVHSYLLEKIPELGELDSLLVVDLYCPFIFENLEIHRDRGLPLDEREQIHHNDLKVLNNQLLKGDYFLAASDRQRDWILGALTSLGRLRPSTCGPGAGPEDFVGLLPFGLSDDHSTDLSEGASVMRGVWPGIGSEDIVLLWGGGIWSWLDPLTPVRAMAEIARTRSDIKLVFLSTRTAEDVIEMPVLRELFSYVDRTPGLDQVVIFNKDTFVGYEQRGAYFVEADIGVCAHHHSLESHFAFRTRILDYLSFGLPILTTEDDYFGAFVERKELGRALPVGDVDAWVQAISTLADATVRRRYRERVLESRNDFLWPRVTEGLVSFIRRGADGARLHRHRADISEDAPEPAEPEDRDLSTLSLDALLNLAFERIETLAPVQKSTALSADHDELILYARRLEEELEHLQSHASKLEAKVDLIKRIPLAHKLWKALAYRRS